MDAVVFSRKPGNASAQEFIGEFHEIICMESGENE